MSCDRTWIVLPGAPGGGSILIVTSSLERMRSYAELASRHGQYTFASTPATVDQFLALAVYDLAILCLDVSPDELTQLDRKLQDARTSCVAIAASTDDRDFLRLLDQRLG